MAPVGTHPLKNQFPGVLRSLGLSRPGVSFYALRHTFATVGGETGDQVAVNSIMGHVDSTMAATYRERISDERLRAVTDHVHSWLFPPVAKKEKSAKQVGRAMR